MAAYSLMLPEWMSSTAELTPALLGYHDWMASTPLSRRLYARTVGLHVGLLGANMTLLAVPTLGPEEECKPSPRPVRKVGLKGCFPELNLKDCSPNSSNAIASSTLLAIRHSRAERLGQMFRGDGSPEMPTVVAGTARKLLWHEWSDEAEDSYHSHEARRSKPVHFSIRSSQGPNASVPPTKASGKTSNTSSPTSSNKTTLATRPRLGPCGTVGAAMSPPGPAFFDERIDFLYGSGPGLSFTSLLERGAPGPILTMAKYLSSTWDYGSGGGEGGGWYSGSYDWGGKLRKAGYWSSCLLTASLVFWTFSIPLQMSVPESGAKLLGLSGILMLAAAPTYAELLSYPEHHIHVEGVALPLRWGACFYCSLVAGVWATIAGFGLAILRHTFPGAFTTDLDLEEVKQRTAKKRPVVFPESEGPSTMLQFT
ncbi:uncharacterized protein LOC124165320 isoform X2 [Ischnura elegans]|nr:uncharacterized protein LOC124165320 isoform X2 [Ischnura elegans]